MAHVKVYAGICGFVTEVEASSPDRQHVTLKVESDCPDVRKILKRLQSEVWDAYLEIGPCAQPGNMHDTKLMRLCGELPHVACPVPAGIAKALEVAANLAIPRDAHIYVKPETGNRKPETERTDPE